MSGGYREGSGRSKSGYYKGIYYGSTYELCWGIYSIDHGIKFTRFPGKLSKDGVSYIPDFLLEDGKTIIECKGYENPLKVDAKTKVAESYGFAVIVLRKNDLKYAFDYVSEMYGTKKFHTLYDEYKPIYSYQCDHCLNDFGTDVIREKEKKFYGRICAGSHRKNSNMELPTRYFVNRKPCKKSLKNKKHNLSKELALEIFYDTMSYSKISLKYGISKALVGFIKIKYSYAWIHSV